MGHHELSCGECDNPADLWMARAAAREAKLFSTLDRGVYLGVRLMRNGWKPHLYNRIARRAGRGWRRLATVEPGGSVRRLPAGEARTGDDGLWDGGASCAGRRADARGLYHRQLRLALDLLSECSGRSLGFFHVPRPGHRSGIPAGRACQEPRSEAALRYAGSLPANGDDGLLGGDAQQGTGVGLARRSLLPGADAVDLVRAGAGHLDLSRVAAPQSTHRSENAGRPELRHLLRDYLLRVWRSLRQHHKYSIPAAVTLRLRRNDVRAGAITIRNLCDYHARPRRRRSRPRGRCPLPDGGRALHDVRGELLDGTSESG